MAGLGSACRTANGPVAAFTYRDQLILHVESALVQIPAEYGWAVDGWFAAAERHRTANSGALPACPRRRQARGLDTINTRSLRVSVVVAARETRAAEVRAGQAARRPSIVREAVA